eukprot:751743-Amphidinium_carterae.1
MYALLLLLSRFAGQSKSGTAKHEPLQTSWHVFMTSLLHRCFPETSEHTLVIALDTRATVVPGKPIKGNIYVKLALQGTKVDLTPLLVADHNLAT